MPISRSGTMRSKSPRSAVPPRTPNTSSTSSPPQFMPPSYYAAAADDYFQRKDTKYATHRIGGQVIENEKSFNSKTLNTKGSTRYSHAAGPSSSETSIVEHLPDLNDLTKRQSTRTGFTVLEAQLLPSLRDTIDRMTGAPSRLSTYMPGLEHAEDTWRGTARKDSGASGSPWKDPTPTMKNRSWQSSQRRDQYADEETDIHPPHIQATPTIGTPLSSLKAPVKSVLKSSLKSPVPSTATINTPTSSSKSPSTSGTSLKTMKSLLTRKCSGPLRSPLNGTKARESSQKVCEDFSVDCCYWAYNCLG